MAPEPLWFSLSIRRSLNQAVHYIFFIGCNCCRSTFDTRASLGWKSKFKNLHHSKAFSVIANGRYLKEALPRQSIPPAHLTPNILQSFSGFRWRFKINTRRNLKRYFIDWQSCMPVVGETRWGSAPRGVTRLCIAHFRGSCTNICSHAAPLNRAARETEDSEIDIHQSAACSVERDYSPEPFENTRLASTSEASSDMMSSALSTRSRSATSRLA
jgi:hypothetical protein